MSVRDDFLPVGDSSCGGLTISTTLDSGQQRLCMLLGYLRRAFGTPASCMYNSGSDNLSAMTIARSKSACRGHVHENLSAGKVSAVAVRVHKDAVVSACRAGGCIVTFFMMSFKDPIS